MVRPPATEIQSYRYSNRIVARRLTLPLNRDPRRQPPARRLRHPRACSRRPMVYRCGTHRHIAPPQTPRTGWSLTPTAYEHGNTIGYQ